MQQTLFCKIVVCNTAKLGVDAIPSKLPSKYKASITDTNPISITC